VNVHTQASILVLPRAVSYNQAEDNTVLFVNAAANVCSAVVTGVLEYVPISVAFCVPTASIIGVALKNSIQALQLTVAQALFIQFTQLNANRSSTAGLGITTSWISFKKIGIPLTQPCGVCTASL
jgi:hypothetical protein